METESNKQKILLVDDSPENLNMMTLLLKDYYQIKVANHGEKALRIAQSETPPDLILLDIMMPDIDGYQVLSVLKKNPRTMDIPVIFLTAKSDIEDEEKGLNLGAADYITKPISPPIIMARVKTHLAAKAANDFLRDNAKFLEQEIIVRGRELSAIQDVTIFALASLAETRDTETGNHIRRTQYYVAALANKLCIHPNFSAFLDENNIELLYKSAPLHDIGKVGIPDRILLKPGRYEPHEFEIMKAHTTLGWESLHNAEKVLGIEVQFLCLAKEIALSHHEKWDGSGYPQGLIGNAIPISARLMALADVYDALISRRIYKLGMSHEEATEIIMSGRARHFDPDVVDAFLSLQNEFSSIAKQYADSEVDLLRVKEYSAQAAHTD